MIKKKILTVFYLLVCFSLLFGGNSPDAEYIEIVKEYKLLEDGSIEFNYQHELKLNTYFSIDRYGETFIVYDPNFQVLEVLKSETTTRDGKKVQSPGNAYNEVLPRFASDAPSYNHFREMVVTHTGLERGSIVDLAYKLTTQKDFLPGLMGEEIFSDYIPIQKMTVQISVPENSNLYYELFNEELEPLIKTDDGYKTYTWTIENVPQVPYERNHAEMGEFSPRLIFSTVDSLEVLQEYLNLFVEKSSGLSTAARRIIDEKLDSALDSQDKMLILQKFVAEEIGFINCDPWIYGYKARSAEETLRENVGTAFEKAILLSTLLKQTGATAYPILVSRYDHFCFKVPSLYQFDDFIVYCKYPNMEGTYLSPISRQDGDLAPSLTEKTLLRIVNSKNLKPIDKVKNYDYKDNYQRMVLDLMISDNLEVEGKGDVDLGCYFNKLYKFSLDNESIKSDIKESLGTLDIKDIKIKALNREEGSFNFEISSTESLKAKNDYIYFELPEFVSGFNNSRISVAQAERGTPIDLHSPFCESYEMTIELPKNLKMVTPKVEKKLKNETGSVTILFKLEDSNLKINKSLMVKTSTILPSQYSDFRNLIQIWQEPKYQELVFKKIK